MGAGRAEARPRPALGPGRPSAGEERRPKICAVKVTGAHGTGRNGKPRHVCFRTLQRTRCEARYSLSLRGPERQSARLRQARPRCLTYYSAPSRNLPQ